MPKNLVNGTNRTETVSVVWRTVIIVDCEMRPELQNGTT